MRRKPRQSRPKAHHAIHRLDRPRLQETYQRIQNHNPSMTDKQAYFLACRQTAAYIPRPNISDVSRELAWSWLRRLFHGAHIAITTCPGSATIEVIRPQNPVRAEADCLGAALHIATYGHFAWPPA